MIETEHISVKPGRLTIRVRVTAGTPLYMSPVLAYKVLATYPELVAHACINEEGRIFGDVIDHTSVPHVLEHLIISEQARNEETPAKANLLGTTQWLDESHGVARIDVNFTNDIVALQAFRNALQFMNEEMVV